jgi:hypothetical protein
VEQELKNSLRRRHISRCNLNGSLTKTMKVKKAYRKVNNLSKLKGLEVSINYKHTINRIVCDWMKKRKERPLRILETNQAEGDATSAYRSYGCVISFEKDHEVYKKLSDRFIEALSLEACLEKGLDLFDIIRECGTQYYPVIIPSKPTDSRNATAILKEKGIKFDVVDVDPFGSPRDFISDVLELLDNESFLFATSGEMYSMRWDTSGTMAPYNVKANSSLKTTRAFFRQDNILIIGSWIIEQGLKKSVALYPVFIYDYYTGYSGVQRIGFFAKKPVSLAQKIELTQQLRYDPQLRVKSLKCSFNDKRSDVPWRFSSASSETQISNFIIKRLNYITKFQKT